MHLNSEEFSAAGFSFSDTTPPSPRSVRPKTKLPIPDFSDYSRSEIAPSSIAPRL
ncbi:hypothetical protein KSP40_PGU013505 [Platanthera guangdongensis]|uniref:Uncharacterized protein n=1 Tax=Platanthera guangdongensis TaxID=2320717 RepID=A0ABR2LX66_9ASPA